MLDIELNAFGKRLGIDSLALNGDGRLGFALDNINVGIEKDPYRHDSPLLMTLDFAVEPSEAPQYFKKALERVSWKNALPFPTRAALFQDRILLSVALDADTVTSADMENVLRHLLNEYQNLL